MCAELVIIVSNSAPNASPSLSLSPPTAAGAAAARNYTVGHTYGTPFIIAPNLSSTCYLYCSEKAPDAVRPFGKNGWVSGCQENSYSSSPEWVQKADRTSSHLLAGHYEERPIIPQPQCGRCHRAGTGLTTLEVIDNKRSYTLKWCKANNDDDYDCRIMFGTCIL